MMILAIPVFWGTTAVTLDGLMVGVAAVAIAAWLGVDLAVIRFRQTNRASS